MKAAIQEKSNSNLINIEWEDGKHSAFPCFFLRDNCQCPKCFHPTSKQRLVHTIEEAPLKVKGIPEIMNGDLQVHWEDGHTSMFPSEWLLQRNFKNERDDGTYSMRTWNAEEMLNGPSKFQFDHILKNDDILYDWIKQLWVDGITILENVPKQTGEVNKLGKRACQTGLRKTNYGETFTVMSKLDPSNLAYTNHGLRLHSDLNYYKYKPEIQMLHCIQQADIGGSNYFVDSFKVADDFKSINPEGYQLLTEVPFQYIDEGADEFGEFLLKHERPMIELDSKKKYKSVNFSNFTRDSYMLGEPDIEEKVYDAYYEFSSMIYDSKYSIDYLLSSGDMVVFNNNRVLHGRRAFDMKKINDLNPNQTTRHLEGAYLDWDLVLSKMRVLAN